MLIRAANPVFLKVAMPANPNLTVLTAASGSQLASWDETARHGLFTHHLLDALYGKADRDADGRITLAETRRYLIRHMTRSARRSYLREQIASVHGPDSAILAAYSADQPPVRSGADTPAPVSAPAAVALEPIDAEYVTIRNANVRDRPTVKGDKLTTLPRGTKVAVLGKVKGADWYAVELEDGRDAYVYAALLAEAASSRAAAVDPQAARSIVLDSGLTLADWALLADRRGDSTALLVEAAALRRQFGDVPAVIAVLDKAIASELEGLSAAAMRDPRATLERLARLEASAGPRPAILLLKARALHKQEDFAAAERAYGAWLRQVPQSHPERQKVAVGLFKAQKRRPPGPSVGESFRDCPTCPEMVVPAGSFMMGSPERELDRYDDEGPQHRVTIAAAFAVGKFEVTFAEWDACVAAGGCSYQPTDGSWGRGRRPEINVSWDDVQAYVAWLRRETGKRYRLLSEAEWEYAARAGSTSRYSWGDSVGSNNANCDGCGSRWDNRQTAPVGGFAPNAFGVHDMHGNVWEWVEDCWHGSYAGAPGDGSARSRGADCSQRVLRGGSWNYFSRFLRSANRIWFVTGAKFNIAGFRIARTL